MQSGIHLPGATQFRDRILRPVFELVGEPQIVVKLRIIGIDSQGLLKIIDRLIEGRKLNVADAEILVDGWIFRIFGDGAFEIIEPLFAFSSERERQTEIGKRGRVVRFALYRLLKLTGTASLLSSEPLQCHSQFQLRAGQI